MTLVTQISDLATATGTAIKQTRATIGPLANLTTTEKSNLVAAINEVLAAVGSGGAIDADSISDATSVGRAVLRAVDAGAARSTLGVYSTGDTDAAISSAVAGLVDGAPGVLDTLKELADALGSDANFATTTTTALGNRLRVDANQSLSGVQQKQGRDNLSVYSQAEIGDVSTDFTTVLASALA